MAIILNELVGNALKHGLKDAVEGRIRVELLAGEDALVLTVADDGAGLPQGFTASPHQGLGLLLVKTMAEGEFRGRFSLEPGARGAVARLTIPRDALRTDVSPIEVET
jgi:two-component sensor histidine kinase